MHFVVLLVFLDGNDLLEFPDVVVQLVLPESPDDVVEVLLELLDFEQIDDLIEHVDVVLLVVFELMLLMRFF